MTKDETWTAESVGPVDLCKFPRPVGRGGLMLFLGHNGSGKSVVLDAIAAAQGDAKARKRITASDGAVQGRLEAGGVTLTVGARKRTTGENDVVLFDLAGSLEPSRFVDPQISDPVVADAKRIEELCVLAGLTTTPDEWTGRCGSDVVEQVPNEEFEKGPVRVSKVLKRALETEARKVEGIVERKGGELDAKREVIADVNLEAEHDEVALRQAHLDAVRDLTTLESQRDEHDAAVMRIAEAREAIASVSEGGGESEAEIRDRVRLASLRMEDCDAEIAERRSKVEALEREMADLREERATLEGARAVDHQKLDALQDSARERAEHERVIDAGLPAAPPADAIADAKAYAEQCEHAMTAGAAIREALRAKVEADELADEVRSLSNKAQHMREQARSVEQVLTEILAKSNVPGFSVQDGRLMFEHAARGKAVPVAQLSEGERWRVALELVSRRIGEGGVIAVPQDAAESLDPERLAEVDSIAEELGLVIYSARATSGGLRAVRFEKGMFA